VEDVNFQIGDIVECVDSEGYERFVTVERGYEVLSISTQSDGQHCRFTSDKGYSVGARSNRFRLVPIKEVTIEQLARMF
jgi:hypothetical protein